MRPQRASASPYVAAGNWKLQPGFGLTQNPYQRFNADRLTLGGEFNWEAPRDFDFQAFRRLNAPQTTTRVLPVDFEGLFRLDGKLGRANFVGARFRYFSAAPRAIPVPSVG